jgi:hypothetical protein
VESILGRIGKDAMGYLDRALKEKKAKVTLYWDEATLLAAGEFCLHHRGWNKSTFSEAAVLEKLERDKEQAKKPVDLIMRHTSKET